MIALCACGSDSVDWKRNLQPCRQGECDRQDDRGIPGLRTDRTRIAITWGLRVPERSVQLQRILPTAWHQCRVPKSGKKSGHWQSYKLELPQFRSSPKITPRADQDGWRVRFATLVGNQTLDTMERVVVASRSATLRPPMVLVVSLGWILMDGDDPCGQAFMEHSPRCC